MIGLDRIETCHLNINGRRGNEPFSKYIFINIQLCNNTNGSLKFIHHHIKKIISIAQLSHTSTTFPFAFMNETRCFKQSNEVYLRKHNEERVRNSSCCARDYYNVFFFLSFVYFSLLQRVDLHSAFHYS